MGEVVRQAPPQNKSAEAVQKWLDANRETLEVQIPANVNPQMLLAQYQMQVRTNPVLSECSLPSLLRCLVHAAHYGLTLGTFNSCWMIPFKGEAQLVLGYGGLARIAKACNELRWYKCELVYRGDRFELTQDNDVIHEYDPFNDGRETELYAPNSKHWSGRVLGAYCVIVRPDGSKARDVMTVKDIERTRAKSRGRDSMMWVEFWGEGAKKTVFRRCMKQLQLDSHAASTVQASDEEFDFQQAQQATATVTKAPSRATAAKAILDRSIGEPEPEPEPDPAPEPAPEQADNPPPDPEDSRPQWRLVLDDGQIEPIPPLDQIEVKKQWMQANKGKTLKPGATYEAMGQRWLFG